MTIFKIKLYFYILPRVYISIIIEQLTNKVQVFATQKRQMPWLTVNLNIRVKPSDLKQDYGWKTWS